jgi:1-acyl-sn-glycerol-3-phosphate acyltransferase
MILHKLLLTIFLLTTIVITFLVSLPILIIAYPFLEQKKFARLNEHLGSISFKAMSVLGFWSIKITDLRKEKDYDKQYVLVANHGSYVDTLVMWQLPFYKKFIMAEKFTKIPIFGKICKACGHIFVDRFNPNTTVDAVDKAYNTIQDGSCIVIFPEGMRSEDPYKLLPFKTGSFRLAQKAEIPILPITIKGTGEALPVGGLCGLANIEIVIGEPIEVSPDHTDIKTHPVIQQVRSFILQNLEYRINDSKN